MPTDPVEETDAEFQARLPEMIREIGHYDATAEATKRIVQASQIAAAVGETHRSFVER